MPESLAQAAASTVCPLASRPSWTWPVSIGVHSPVECLLLLVIQCLHLLVQADGGQYGRSGAVRAVAMGASCLHTGLDLPPQRAQGNTQCWHQHRLCLA